MRAYVADEAQWQDYRRLEGTSSKGRPIHHSSLAKGKRVAATGEMVVRNGRLESINNQSGHYFPTAHHHAQVVYELRNRGTRNFRSTTGSRLDGDLQTQH